MIFKRHNPWMLPTFILGLLSCVTFVLENAIGVEDHEAGDVKKLVEDAYLKAVKDSLVLEPFALSNDEFEARYPGVHFFSITFRHVGEALTLNMNTGTHCVVDAGRTARVYANKFDSIDFILESNPLKIHAKEDARLALEVFGLVVNEVVELNGDGYEVYLDDKWISRKVFFRLRTDDSGEIVSSEWDRVERRG